MRAPARNALCLAAALLALPSPASAVAVDFSAGSWIIPMESCYQPSASQQCSDSTPTGQCTPKAYSNGWPSVYQTAADGRQLSTFYPNGTCPEPLTLTPARDGITKAYGLVYRLLQRGVPIYYVVQTNTDTTHPPYKTSITGTDLTITGPANTNPVQLLNHTPGSASFGQSVNFMTAGHNAIDYRGAPFVIAAGDVVKYNVANLLKTDSQIAATDPRTGRGYFQDVYIHVAQTNILQAPVRALLNQSPPRLALLGVGGAGITNLRGYLMDAGLFSNSAVATYPAIGDVFTEFVNASDVTAANLANGGFKLLWAPHWDASVMTTAQADAVLSAIGQFNATGGTVMLQCASISSAEGVFGSLWNTPGNQYGHFLTTATGTNKAFEANVIPYYADTALHPVYPSGTAGEGFSANPANEPELWSEPLIQVGDFPLLYTNRQAAVFDFVPSGSSYKPTVDRLLATTAPGNEGSYQNRDVFVRNPAQGSAGQMLYIGGHTLSSVHSGCNAYTCAAFTSWQCANWAPGASCAPNNGNCCDYGSPGTMPGLERLVLNSIIFLGQIPVSAERTRSSPVVFSDGKTYLGTYVQKSQPTATYPPWSGHFREYPVNALAGTNVSAFQSIAQITWDAATRVAAQAQAGTRTIFTSVLVNGKQTQTAFTSANATALGVAANTITAIRGGGLGGIDHSIPAVIGPSALAGNPNRPTVAYVGALDGMLHAFLVSGTVAGKSAGDELWAFIPNSQIGKVSTQSGGVDGSPSVGDAFIDVGNGVRAWRTVLAIPDGGYAGGTIDAIDITDPVNPLFLWKGSDSTTIGGKTYVMGRAQGAGIGSIGGANGLQYAVFVATDNTTGSAGNAFNMYALDAGTGAVIWRFNHLYAADTTHNDVPGAVAIIDATGQDGNADTVFFGDLEGKVWAVPAATGPIGSPAPVYDAASANGQSGSVNFPIESALALYRDPTTQHLMALGVTGGADWVPQATLSYVFTWDAQTKSGTTLSTLAAGERAYAAPTVYGNAVYLITSSGAIQGSIGTDFGLSGYLVRINLGASAGLTRLAQVTQGASELWVDTGGRVVAASTTGLTQNGNAGEDKSQGVVGLQNSARPVTVQAWLDAH